MPSPSDLDQWWVVPGRYMPQRTYASLVGETDIRQLSKLMPVFYSDELVASMTNSVGRPAPGLFACETDSGLQLMHTRQPLPLVFS